MASLRKGGWVSARLIEHHGCSFQGGSLGNLGKIGSENRPQGGFSPLGIFLSQCSGHELTGKREAAAGWASQHQNATD
jgi:hypothetical protein